MTEKNIDHLITVLLAFGLMYYFVTLSRDSNKPANPTGNSSPSEKPIETNWFKKNDYRNTYWLIGISLAITLFIMKLLIKS
jgi:hypothetical protein